MDQEAAPLNDYLFNFKTANSFTSIVCFFYKEEIMTRGIDLTVKINW